MATSDRILRGIKRRITIPANEVLLDDDDMLEICDDVLKVKITPMIISLRQEFLLTLEEETTVEDQADYAIPYRAVGRTLRELKLRLGDNSIIDLIRIDLEDKQYFTGYGNNSGCPVGYFFKSDKFRLVPTPQSADYTIEKWYEIAISELVKEEQAAQVATIDRPNSTLTVSSVPDDLEPNVLIDFIAGRPGHSIITFDQTLVNVVGTEFTFGTDVIPEDLAVGDWISLAGTSPVVQIPEELTVYFETKAAERILYAVGDFVGLDKLKEDSKVELEDMQKLLQPRNRGASTKIINRRGLLRRGAPTGWYGRDIVGP